MSKLVLNSGDPPDPPNEGQVVLVVVGGVLYAWAYEQIPAPLTANGSSMWTAQFSGTLTAGQQVGFSEALPPPYPISLPQAVEPKAALRQVAAPNNLGAAARVAAATVLVESNTLNAAAVVVVSSGGIFVELAAAETGVRSSSAPNFAPIYVGDVVTVGVESKDATSGSITLHVTVAFERFATQ